MFSLDLLSLLLIVFSICLLIMSWSFYRKESILLHNYIAVKQHQSDHMLEIATTEELVSALTKRDEPPLVVIWFSNKNNLSDFQYFLFRNKVNHEQVIASLEKILKEQKNT